MKRFVLSLVLVLFFLETLPAADQGELKRRGFFGVATAPVDAGTNAGTKITYVWPGSFAAASGLKVGDIITSIDGKKVNAPNVFTAVARTLHTGDKTTVQYQRDGKPATAEGVLPEERRETYASADVIYDFVTGAKNQRLRTIITKPKNAQGKLPVIFLAGWLSEEAEHPPVAPPPQRAPAPFWVPREPEPELQPIPFASDDSASRHAPPPSMRADEAPTQQIPLGAEYAAFGRPSAAPDRITDKTPPVSEIGEATASIKAPAGEPYLTPPIVVKAPAEAPAEAPVSREIEVLAQTTSIGQLKEMLSSVSRGEGGLTDDEIDRLASRVVERLSEKIVREIAWEVIPDVAELVIKQRIKELESNVE
jgi:hypothetical protein